MAHQHVTSDYMAHGFCFSWETPLVWLHVASDIVTGIAYYSIPLAMFYFAAKRRDLPFYNILILFATFILACGTTHFFAAYTVFEPLYWEEGYVKAFTAIISLFSAILLIPLIPKAIALPSLPRALADNQELNTQLNRRVDELRATTRTLEKANDEKEQLIHQLQDKTTELERFIYTISHDLKSPLITISGFLGFLEKDFTSRDLDGFRSTLGRISQASERMKQLLDELLELSRIGRKISPPQTFSLGDLVRDAMEIVSGRISSSGTVVEIETALPDVRADRQRLLQVFENLIDNAVKFSSASPSPHVWIGVRRDNDEKVYYVRDNVAGIEPQYLEKVFELFEKLDPRSSGTGVGLAICKRIIEIHGGRFWAESAGIGCGATFCFTLSDLKGEKNS